MGLEEAKFQCLPETHSDKRGGEMGADTLLNMFNLPNQIRGIIRREVLTKIRRERPAATLADVKITNLQILGLPHLTFGKDESMADFHRF